MVTDDSRDIHSSKEEVDSVEKISLTVLSLLSAHITNGTISAVPASHHNQWNHLRFGPIRLRLYISSCLRLSVPVPSCRTQISLSISI
ncbi:hypothetical protein L2E82_38013 [Cichorium intybus]|uniref:Uncharacterized protein n=1 Tax=Cichorium intybus TaxID=13427 RepID=A0ACB9AFZ9_CICIN|nr:hypothetical protein L2E82_38013 [Cichorium intybus]